MWWCTHLAHGISTGLRGFFPVVSIAFFWLCVRVRNSRYATASKWCNKNQRESVCVCLHKFVCVQYYHRHHHHPPPPMILIKIVICPIKHFMLIASALMDTVVHAVIRTFLLPAMHGFSKRILEQTKWNIKCEKNGRKNFGETGIFQRRGYPRAELNHMR